MNVFVFIPFITLLALMSCASKGFNRGELSKQIGVVNQVIDDEKIEKTFKTQANLPKPFKLAIYFKSPIRSRISLVDWRWTQENKNLIVKEIEKTQVDNNISDVFLISESLVQNEDLLSIRMASARHGADAVLVVSGTSVVDRYFNNLGLSYFLIAPALFIKGSEVEALFISNATMWDVKNEFLYLSAEAEGHVEETYIAAFGSSNKSLIKKTKENSLIKLSKQLKAMIEGK